VIFPYDTFNYFRYFFSTNVGTWSAWLVERRSWHANVRPTLGQREQPNRWVDMVGPMLARRMIFDGEMCSRLANVGICILDI
jgi:hypothetical protein